MRRLLVIALGSVVLCLAGWAGEASAGSGDADGLYTITITQIQFSTDGVTFTTVFTGSQDVNIAGASGGAIAASLVDLTLIPAGLYTTVRANVGTNLQIKGWVNDGADTLYTNGTTFDRNVGSNNTPGGDYATSTFTITGAREFDQGGLSLDVGPGRKAVCTVKFDTAGVITTTPDINPPAVTIASRLQN